MPLSGVPAVTDDRNVAATVLGLPVTAEGVDGPGRAEGLIAAGVVKGSAAEERGRRELNWRWVGRRARRERQREQIMVL